jgi:hypothetical protein
MLASMDARCDKQPHAYLLKPTGGALKVIMNKKSDNFDFPKLRAELVLHSVKFVVEPRQYATTLFLAHRLEYAQASRRYLKGKPKERPTTAPRLWWKWTLDSIMDPIKRRNSIWNPENFKQRGVRREKYVALYVKLLATGSLSASDKTSLDVLEEALTFEDIMYFRALAEIQAKKEKEVKKEVQSASQQQGWGSWLGSFFGGSSTTTLASQAPSTPVAASQQSSSTNSTSYWDSVRLSDDEQQALFEAVNFERSHASGGPATSSRTPASYEKFVFKWRNESGSILLVDNDSNKIASFGISGFVFDTCLRKQQTSFSATLDRIYVTDHFSPKTLFPQLVYPQSRTDERLLEFKLVYNSKLQASSTQSLSSTQANNDPDWDVYFSMKKLNVVLNTELTKRIAEFFTKPLLEADTVRAKTVQQVAAVRSYWSSWSQSEKRNAQLLALAEMEKTIRIDIQASAPTILVPHKCDYSDSSLLILGLGTLSFKTAETSTSDPQAASTPTDTLLPGQTPMKTEFYTTHQIALSDVHVTLSTVSKFKELETDNTGASFTSDERLLFPISSSLTAAVCKINSETLAKVRIFSSIQEIHLHLASPTALKLRRLLASVFKRLTAAFAIKKLPSPKDTRPEPSLVLSSSDAMPGLIPSPSVEGRAKNLLDRRAPGWTSAISYTEMMVGASNLTSQEPKTGVGVSFESHMPSIRVTLLHKMEDQNSSNDGPPQSPSKLIAQFEVAFSDIGYLLETRSTSITVHSRLGSVVAKAVDSSGGSINLLDSTLNFSSTKSLETSGNPLIKSNNGNLITLQITHRKKNDEEYARIDNEALLHFRELFVTLHSPMLHRFMDFINLVSKKEEKPQESSTSPDLPSSVSPASPHPIASDWTPSKKNDRTEFQLTMRCDAIQVVFFDLDLLPLAECSLRKSNIAFAIVKRQGFRFNAVLGNLSVTDTSQSTAQASVRRHLISVVGDQTIQVEITDIQPSVNSTIVQSFPSGIIPKFTTANVQLTSMRVLLNPKWLFNMLLSVNELTEAFDHPDQVTNALEATQRANDLSIPDSKPPSFFAYSVKIVDTFVSFPQDEKSTAVVTADLGEIQISSSLQESIKTAPLNVNRRQYLETIQLALRKVNITTGELTNNEQARNLGTTEDYGQLNNSAVLTNTDIDMSLTSAFYPGTKIPREDNLIRVDVPNLTLGFFPEQAHILFRAVQNNVFYTPTPLEIARRVKQATAAENLALLSNPQLYQAGGVLKKEKQVYEILLQKVRVEIKECVRPDPEARKPVKLLGLELNQFSSTVKFFTDDSMHVAFQCFKMSAEDLRPIDVLPESHPLAGSSIQTLTKTDRLIIFPARHPDAQLIGSYSTLPSKNQMTTEIKITELQILPEATILQQVQKASNPVIADMLALLAHRESIMTLTMAPLQKANFFRLKSHPETNAQYRVTLTRPEILLATSTPHGLKFAATSPSSVEITYSQAPEMKITQFYMKELAVTAGAVSSLDRSVLFELASPDQTQTKVVPLYHYDIMSPLTLQANVLMTTTNHHYELEILKPLKMTASFLDYLDLMEMVNPFLKAAEEIVDDVSSSEIGFEAATKLLYDPAPIRAYPEVSGSDSDLADNLVMKMLSGSQSPTIASAFSGSPKSGRSSPKEQNPSKIAAEDDIYKRIVETESPESPNPPALNQSSVSSPSPQASSSSKSPKSLESPSSSSSSQTSSSSSTTHRRRAGRSSVAPPMMPTSVSTPGTLTSPSSKPNDMSQTFNPSASSSELPPPTEPIPIYVTKTLNISSFKVELMVMDNQQSDLGVIRFSLDFTSLWLHNWDVEGFRSNLTSSQRNYLSSQTTDLLPPRKAHLEANIHAECFSPLVAAWEPLAGPLQVEVSIDGTDLRIVSLTGVDFIVSTNLLSSFQRIISVLDTDATVERGELTTHVNSIYTSRTPTASMGIGSRIRTKHAYFVKNATGAPIKYSVVSQDTMTSTPFKVLDSDAEEPIVIPEPLINRIGDARFAQTGQKGQFVADRAEMAKHRSTFTLTVEVQAGMDSERNRSIRDISFNTIGCRVNPLDERRSMVIDVQYRQGAKVVTLKSRISIHNNTAHPLIIGMEMGRIAAPSTPKKGQSPAKPSAMTLQTLEVKNTSLSTSSSTATGSLSRVLLPDGSQISISQLCSVEPFGWFHVPIDLVYDGVLRFRPGRTTDVSFTPTLPSSSSSASSSHSTATVFSYKWSEYRCELKRLNASRPRNVTCLPADASASLAHSATSSSNIVNVFQYSMGVCRIATKDSIFAGADELVLHFQPPLVIENLLPTNAEFLIQAGDLPQAALKFKPKTPSGLDQIFMPQVDRIRSGERLSLHNISADLPLQFSLNVDGFDWSRCVPICNPVIMDERGKPLDILAPLADRLDLPEKQPKSTRLGTSPVQQQGRALQVVLDNQVTEYGTRLLSFYTLYWVVNKTGLPLLACADSSTPASIGAGMSAISLGIDQPHSTVDAENAMQVTLVDFFNPAFSAGCLPSSQLRQMTPRSTQHGTPMPSPANSSKVPSNASEWEDRLKSSGASHGLGSSSASLSSSSGWKQARIVPEPPPSHAPMMYCPTGFDNEKFCLRVGGSQWSNPQPLNTQNNLSRISIPGLKPPNGTDPRKLFELALSVGPAADRFWRTTVLTISPRYLLINKMSVNLYLKQPGTSVEAVLRPGECAPWHWPAIDKGNSEQVQLRLDLPGCSWSGNMLMEERTMYTFTLMDNSTRNRYFVRVMPRLHAETGITTIIFKQEDQKNPLFRIENQLSVPLQIQQTGLDPKNFPHASDTVTSFHTRIWGWNNPHTMEQGVELMIGSKNKINRNFSLTKVKTYPSFFIRLDGGARMEVVVTVSTDKSTRVLRIQPAHSVEAFSSRGRSSSPQQRRVATVQDRSMRVLADSRSSQDSPRGNRQDSQRSSPAFSSSVLDSPRPGDLSIDGPRGTLIQPPESPAKFELRPSTIEEVKKEEEEEVDPDKIRWKIGLALRKITISVINDEPQEILFGEVSRIAAEFILYPKRWTVETQIGDIQFDNQDPLTYFPVAICSSGDSPLYWLQFSLIRSTEYPDIICQPLISLLVKETHVRVDESLVLKLLDLYNSRKSAKGLSVPSRITTPKQQELVKLTSNVDILTMGINEDASKMVYTEFALLNPIHILLSFHYSRVFLDDARQRERQEYLLLKSSRYNPGSIQGIGVQTDLPALYQALAAPLALFLSFDRAPIFLKSLYVTHSFVSWNLLQETVIAHYSTQLTQHIAAIGGSLDITGDVISLAYNLGSGVRDLFYEPAKGIAISPLAFGQGLGRGGAKFVKKSVTGIFNTLNKVFGTVASVAAVASVDQDYQGKRAQMKRKDQPKNVVFGLGQGLFEMGKGFFEGVTGVVSQPIKGARKDGAAGFFEGVAKGMAGLVVKPVVGTLDLLQRTTEGIRNTAADAVRNKRCRWPAYIAEDGVIRHYDRVRSLAMRMLHHVENGSFAHEDFWGYFVCSVTPDTSSDALLGLALLASTRRIILISTTAKPVKKSKGLLIPPARRPRIQFKFQLPYANIVTHLATFQDGDKSVIVIEARSPAGVKSRHTIPCSGPRSRVDELDVWIRSRRDKYNKLARFFQQSLD